MLQLPGGAIKVKANFSLNADTEYELKVFEYGDLTVKSGEICTAVGDEFNPWAQPAQAPQWNGYSWTTPSYASENQGKIDGFETDESGNAEFLQHYFLQNLGGKDSLIGKSIVLFEKDDDTPINCCIIARDIYRAPEEDTVDPIDD